MRSRSPLEALAQTPRRFGFDAAIRVLTLARRTEDPAEVARFRSPPGLTYPPAEVLEYRGSGKPDVTVGMIGLTGPSGVLPRHYTDAVVQALLSAFRRATRFPPCDRRRRWRRSATPPAAPARRTPGFEGQAAR